MIVMNSSVIHNHNHLPAPQNQQGRSSILSPVALVTCRGPAQSTRYQSEESTGERTGAGSRGIIIILLVSETTETHTRTYSRPQMSSFFSSILEKAVDKAGKYEWGEGGAREGWGEEVEDNSGWRKISLLYRFWISELCAEFCTFSECIFNTPTHSSLRNNEHQAIAHKDGKTL